MSSHVRDVIASTLIEVTSSGGILEVKEGDRNEGFDVASHVGNFRGGNVNSDVDAVLGDEGIQMVG